jgi:hypothetical protein
MYIIERGKHRTTILTKKFGRTGLNKCRHGWVGYGMTGFRHKRALGTLLCQKLQIGLFYIRGQLTRLGEQGLVAEQQDKGKTECMKEFVHLCKGSKKNRDSRFFLSYKL